MKKTNLILAIAMQLIFVPLIFGNISPVPNTSSVKEQNWFIVSAEQTWEAEEIVMIQELLTTVISALDEQGLDGQALLTGYRFRRQHGEYITGYPGRIAVVNHETQEITLADAAFKRLHGFYIIHELGHVVDRRTGRQLTTTFHNLASSDMEHRSTAPGYWLNLHAEHDLEEATADAFALWILSIYDAGYRPFFAHTPATADYAEITAVLVTSLNSVALAQ
jgi:hypothetical protein